MRLLYILLNFPTLPTGFNFENIFEQAFGGGVRFEMGGGRGGMQMPKPVQFPGGIKNEIAPEFEWLKGTEWNWGERETIKFTLDGVLISSFGECQPQSRCLWSAYNGQVNLMMSRSGLFKAKIPSLPDSSDTQHLRSMRIRYTRSNGDSDAETTFSRIFDYTSREDALDLYGVLGVDQEADTATIKKAYRRLSVEHHPDQSKDDPVSAQAKFNEITKANTILSDPIKRLMYDTGGMEAIRAMEKGEIQNGQDMLFEIQVPLNLLYTGGDSGVTFRRRVVCSQCRVNPKQEKCRGCSRCPGEVRMVNQQVAPGFYMQQQVQVESKEYCKIDDSKLEFRIEKGMVDGTDIVIERMAEQRPGIIPGNVIVRIRQKQDPKFQRNGNDLKTSISVPLVDALAGFEKGLVHLDGENIVINRNNKVTQPREVVKIEGQGMPIRGDMDGRGDLFVTVEIDFPRKSLSKEQRAAIIAAFPGDDTPKLIKANSI
jgi:DnaJ-class molecular chaperone